MHCNLAPKLEKHVCALDPQELNKSNVGNFLIFFSGENQEEQGECEVQGAMQPLPLHTCHPGS